MSTHNVEVLPAVRQQEVSVKDFLPLMTVADAIGRKDQINGFIGKVLVEDLDYGKIPGGQQKKVLLKPGAEKLCSIFGLAPRYVKEVIVEDWTGADHEGEPLFSYEYRCQLYRGDRFMGESLGSCNTWETKYRYRWVSEAEARKRPDFDTLPTRGGRQFEPLFAIEKAETSGKYGKPAEYWERFRQAIAAGAEQVKKKLGAKEFNGYEIDSTMYRVPNPDVADVVNTCQKIAQKRALVSAVLVVTNCSDSFTPDLEDFIEPERSEQRQEEPERHAVQQPTYIPPELRPIFAGMRRDAKNITGAYELMAKQLSAFDGGLDLYDRLCDAMTKKYPKGAPVDVHEKCILDLWEGLQEYKRQAVQPEVIA